MQSGFIRFKKRQTRITLINSLIWGLAAGLLAVGALLLISKLSKNSLHVIFYVLVPVVAFVAAMAIAYLFFHQKDKKLAKRLDEEFALNDRVQTMIEFQNEQTDMIRLQREDAEARLNGLTLSKFKWKGLWVCLASLVCAIAVFVSGLVLPQHEVKGNNPPPGGSETVFEITNDQKTKLATLIKNVKSSSAEDAVKTAIVTELEALQVQLDEFETPEELYAELVDIIVVIDEFVENHNTYKRIYGHLRWESEVVSDGEQLSDEESNSSDESNSDEESNSSDEFNSDDESNSDEELKAVEMFAIGIGLNDLNGTVDALKVAFQNEENDKNLILRAIGEFVSDLKTRFAKVQESAEDPLVIAIAKLIEDVEQVTLSSGSSKYSQVFSSIEIALTDSVKPLTTALVQQADNRTVTDNTIEELIYIFQLPAQQIPKWGGESLEGLDNFGSNEENTDESGDDFFEEGTKYPSNEQVYDYYTKVICEYGKVFEGDVYNYKAAINALIAEGVANGTISPEMEKMLRSYLDALSGSGSNIDGPEVKE